MTQTMSSHGLLGQVSYAFYDLANNSFPTVITTFVFSTYFTQAIAPSAETGTVLWSWTMSLAALPVALLSPVLGAIADRSGPRKPWLLLFTFVTILASALLWYALPEPPFIMWALFWVGVGTMTSEMATVFYNAMLPEIVSRRAMGRLSGYSWAAGYAGGLGCLLLALVGFVQADRPWFGITRDDAEHIRVTVLLVAVWYALFAVPLFLWTPDRRSAGESLGTAITRGVGGLGHSLRRLGGAPILLRFLIARMIYTDGLTTLFAFGGIYAAGTFGMSVAEVIQFGIALNVTAGLGAALFGWIDDRIGSRRTVLAGLVGLLVFGTAILLVQDVASFWILGLMLGVFFGPTQAASRTLMARLAPEDLRAEAFGLYAVSGKATAFVGPAVLGAVTALLESQRAGMATILVFLLVGAGLLWSIDPAVDDTNE